MKHTWISSIFLMINLCFIPFAMSQDKTPIKFLDIQDFDLSPDNQRLVTFDSHHLVKVVDVETGDVLHQLQGSSSRLFNVVSWSSNGKVIIGSFDNGVHLWDAATGDLLHHFSSETPNDLSVVKISHDGKLLAVARQQDFSITLYELTGYNIVYRLELDQDIARDLHFSPDISLLAIEQFHGISLWDLNTGKVLFQFPGEVASFSPDQSMIATGGGRLTSEISLWNTATGKLLSTFVAPLHNVDLQWASDSRNLFALLDSSFLVLDGFDYSGEAVRELDLASNQEVNTYSHTTSLSLPVNLDTNEIIIGVGNGLAADSVLVWNKLSGQTYRKTFTNALSAKYEITDKQIRSFDMSDNGRIAVAYEDQIDIYMTDTKHLLTSFLLSSAPQKIRLASYGQSIAVLLADRSLYIFNLPA